MISFQVFAEVNRMPQRARVRRPPLSDRVLDSVVATETSGDWRLVLIRAYPAVALPAMDACDGSQSMSLNRAACFRDLLSCKTTYDPDSRVARCRSTFPQMDGTGEHRGW